MLAILHIKANLNDCFRFPSANAINNTSGGMGKKEASENDNTKRAMAPKGVFAQ